MVMTHGRNFDHLTIVILNFWPWSRSKIFDHMTMTPGRRPNGQKIMVALPSPPGLLPSAACDMILSLDTITGPLIGLINYRCTQGATLKLLDVLLEIPLISDSITTYSIHSADLTSFELTSFEENEH